MPQPPLCLIEGCNRPAKYKGLCLHCYSKAKKLVNAGEETWVSLAALGLASQPQEETDVFTQKYRKKKEQD